MTSPADRYNIKHTIRGEYSMDPGTERPWDNTLIPDSVRAAFVENPERRKIIHELAGITHEYEKVEKHREPVLHRREIVSSSYNPLGVYSAWAPFAHSEGSPAAKMEAFLKEIFPLLGSGVIITTGGNNLGRTEYCLRFPD